MVVFNKPGYAQYLNVVEHKWTNRKHHIERKRENAFKSIAYKLFSFHLSPIVVLGLLIRKINDTFKIGQIR